MYVYKQLIKCRTDNFLSSQENLEKMTIVKTFFILIFWYHAC